MNESSSVSKKRGSKAQRGGSPSRVLKGGGLDTISEMTEQLNSIQQVRIPSIDFTSRPHDLDISLYHDLNQLQHQVPSFVDHRENPSAADDTFDVSYALVNHEDLKPDNSIRSGVLDHHGLNMERDESLVMADMSGLDLRPNNKDHHDPMIEEQKFYDLSSTASKTRGMTNPFTSHPATTSKKRSREEMGN